MPRMRGLSFVSLWFVFLAWLLAMPTWAAETPAAENPEESLQTLNAAPVVIDGQRLFIVRGTSSFPAEKRAELIAGRVVALAADPDFDPASLKLVVENDMLSLMAGGKRIMLLSESDAHLEGIDRQTLGQGVLLRVGEAIQSWRRDRAADTLRRNGLFALGATLVLALLLWGGRRLSRAIHSGLEHRLRRRIQDLQLKEFRIIRAQQIWMLLRTFLTTIWVATILILLYAYLSYVLSLFPWTRELGNNLVVLVLAPLKTMGLGILAIIPDLAFLVVLFFLTRYVLKVLHLFFASVAEGKLTLEQFDADWAWPTYRLIRILLIAFALIVAYPYIPGSGSEAFKGVSLFLGVVFSLGSSSLVGNLIAGYTMTYRRTFRIGDRVSIGEYTGDVEQVRMLVTHLRTPKNEEVVVPNSLILNKEVVNYSSLAAKHGLILHTTVGIGYETPWRQVEAMLLEAAARTPGLLGQPAPFVLQKALGDFCVTYELNVYCGDAHAMPQLYAELHRNIQDVFNEYGVQIMTPAYVADPEQPKLVPKEQWYLAPASRPEA